MYLDSLTDAVRILKRIGDEVHAIHHRARSMLPSTLWSPSLLIACAPRFRSASFPPASRIVPPFRLNAFAAMLIPSASMSVACTT